MMNFLKIISLCILIFSCSSDSTDTPKAVKNKIQTDTMLSWSDENRNNAKMNCINSGNEDLFCECSVEILVSLFSFDEFQEFDRMIRSGTQPHEHIKPRLMEMSKRALEECKIPKSTE